MIKTMAAVSAASMVFLSSPQAAPVGPSLMLHQPISATAQQQFPQTYTLTTQKGNVIEGNLNGREVIVDVVNAQGVHIRRLADGTSSTQPFMFVAPSDQTQLIIRANKPLPYTLTMTDIYLSDGFQKGETQHVQLTSPRLKALEQKLVQGGNTKAFWEEVKEQGTPLIEPLNEKESLVTFLFRGAQHNVRLFGSPSGGHVFLNHLAASDVWWFSYPVANTARLSYQLAPDVPLVKGTSAINRRAVLSTAQRDPYNKNTFPDAGVDQYHGNSTLVMPQAPQQPWVAKHSDILKGTLSHTVFSSHLLHNQRDIWVYLPTQTPEALLILFDGAQYLHKIQTPTVLDNLIADKKVPPTAVILIDNIDQETRSEELPPNPKFADFVATELLPWVKQQYNIAVTSDKTVIAGSSYGGLAAAYIARVHPEHIGNVLSMSGSFWWAPPKRLPNWVSRQYANLPLVPMRFYLDAGRFEGARNGIEGILETNRTLGSVLRAKGYTVTQREHYTGHDYFHWQGALSCGLISLIGQGIETLPACNGIDDHEFTQWDERRSLYQNE